jgi:hypothetical protein
VRRPAAHAVCSACAFVHVACFERVHLLLCFFSRRHSIAFAAESPGESAPQPRPRLVLSAYGKLLIFETPTAPSVRRTVTLYAPPPLQALNPNPFCVESSCFCDHVSRAGALLQTSTEAAPLEFALVPTEGTTVFMRCGTAAAGCAVVVCSC